MFCVTLFLLFMPFWDERSQNLWDKMSNTIVVNDPHNAWVVRPTSGVYG